MGHAIAADVLLAALVVQ